jgi:hypothetical protein
LGPYHPIELIYHYWNSDIDSNFYANCYIHPDIDSDEHSDLNVLSNCIPNCDSNSNQHADSNCNPDLVSNCVSDCNEHCYSVTNVYEYILVLVYPDQHSNDVDLSESNCFPNVDADHY